MTAKDIKVAPIAAKDANRVIKSLHYSGKVVQNSQLHLGVFIGGRIEGAMQFGPSMTKRTVLGLVSNTKWNGFIELNRLAFSERLPRNSESRAIGVAMRMIRKNYPHIEWVLSFADGTQCGDGTIYRASGFVLTGIKKNNQILANQNGQVIIRFTESKKPIIEASKRFRHAGYSPLDGYQLRYIYFINRAAISRLTVPIIPFSRIAEVGASMYLGKKTGRGKEQAPGDPSGLGGATPTSTLQQQQVGA